jgi:hypothetical protein
MQIFRQRKYLFGIAALMLVFAGCKGESPTAPSTSTTPPTTSTTGTTPPPSGASVAVTVSNASPLVNSTSVVTATVTENGQPVPNGTAVEFRTTLGAFTEGNAQSIIRTTTNGVATVTLTSATVGAATVTATVGSVAKSATVTFAAQQVVPPPPNTAPSISAINPPVGRPQGGEVLTISGANFTAPVRVLFDFGGGVTKEATIISVTPTQIQVLTPGVDLGAGQQLQATIILINAAGTSSEARVTSAANAFTFQSTVLTPKITTVSPASGPIDGGTRVVIFGSGFQSPVQVFFGSAEAQVINITFDQIVVVSPTARDTTPNAGTTLTGPVDIRIVNINSATTVTATGIFRYIPKMQITSAGPTEGLFTGGTRVTIDGTGFNDPVAVVIGGVAAQVIRVSGTQVIAVTSPLNVTSCGDKPGPITVTNVDNGDSAPGPTFTYRVPTPAVVSATAGTAGGSITVVVANAYGTPQLRLGGATGPLLNISNATVNANGTATLTATVPTNLQFLTTACPGGGTQKTTTAFDVTFTSLTTNCTSTLVGGAQISPQTAPVLTLLPPAFATFSAHFTPAAFSGTPPVLTTPASITPSSPQTINIINSGFGVGPNAALVINSVSNNCGGNYTISAPAAGTSLNTCENAPVTATFNPPAPAPNATTYSPPPPCTLTINTNAGTQTLTLAGTTG